MVFSAFKNDANLLAGTTGRSFGNFSRLAPESHKKNCTSLQSDSKLKNFFVSLNAHTDQIFDPFKDDLTLPHDALITDRQGICLGILTADCVPIFFYSPSKGVIAISHSGWKGIQQNIAEKTVQKMNMNFGVEPSDLFVEIGPHICSHCYDVGMDVLRNIPGALAFSSKVLHMQDILIKNLINSGVLAESIRATEYCTHCSKDSEGKNMFFSHRHKDTQRMLSFITLLCHQK